MRMAHAASRGRAFRGLALTFVLSFVNLFGVIVTLTAIGGLAPWSRWQFAGFFGLVEAASGLANVLSPNLWRLPVAALDTDERRQTKLAASTILIPHWAALARCAAGSVLIGVAAWHEGLSPASVAVLLVIAALAWLILVISAAVARVAIVRPEVDVVQFAVRWRGRNRELRPVSITASMLQFLLSIATVPAAALLDPSSFYQPEFAPSRWAVLTLLTVSVALTASAYFLWSGRLARRAPAEQQKEAEDHA
jgi:hypothetical protein